MVDLQRGWHGLSTYGDDAGRVDVTPRIVDEIVDFAHQEQTLGGRERLARVVQRRKASQIGGVAHARAQHAGLPERHELDGAFRVAAPWRTGVALEDTVLLAARGVDVVGPDREQLRIAPARRSVGEQHVCVVARPGGEGAHRILIGGPHVAEDADQRSARHPPNAVGGVRD